MAVHDLDADVEARLISAARDVWARAYAPYSKFKVGSAVLASTPSGTEIFAGCNVACSDANPGSAIGVGGKPSRV